MSLSWDDYYCRGWGIDPNVARERLDFLRLEQERAAVMFNPFYDADPLDEPLFYTKTTHPLTFGCQCKKCTRLYTLSMSDRDFLRSIGITWQKKNSTR